MAPSLDPPSAHFLVSLINVHKKSTAHIFWLSTAAHALLRHTPQQTAKAQFRLATPHTQTMFSQFGPRVESDLPFNPNGSFSWFDHSKFGGKTQPKKEQPTTRTQDPIVTGSSILAITYKDGVMMAADTLASYGSLARFRDLRRIRTVGKNTIIGASGEYSDFQFIMHDLDDLVTQYEIVDDNSVLVPSAIHSYLNRVMYQRRNKMDPYWNTAVLAGYHNGKPFLGVTDLQGTHYQDVTVATGYGNYIARPILRKEHRPDMSYEEARKLLETCMRVLFYRDARTINKIQIATITARGAEISEPFELSTDWSAGYFKYPADVKVSGIPQPSASSNDNNNNNAARA